MAKRSRDDFESSSPESINTLKAEMSTGTALTASLPSNSLTSPKLGHLGLLSGEATVLTEIKCSLPPHPQTISFGSHDEYDVHYAQFHVNRCAECRGNFPTAHFLNLHIEENHDSLVGVRRDRGEKTYSCFVEDCDRVCSTPQKRRRHLIDKHLFPNDYDFYLVNDGIDRRNSLLRSGRHQRRSSAAQQISNVGGGARRRASTVQHPNGSEGQPTREVYGKPPEPNRARSFAGGSKDVDMDGLSVAMSALTFVPPSVRFGRGGRARGGFSKT